MCVDTVRWSPLLGLVVIASLACAVGAFAHPGPADPAAAERGRVIFQQSCANCHGVRGNGDGIAASALKPRPTDLTVLTRHNGSFPATRLAAVLQNQDSKGHSLIMQTWRALFLADARGDEAAANGRVHDVVEFIRTLQVK